MTKALQSIVPLLLVKDLQVSIEFYVNKLGFKLGFEDEGAFAGLFRDGCCIYLGQKEEQAVDLRNVSAKTVDDGFASYDLHINCEPGTIDDLWREYRDAGATIHESFEEGPVDRDYGMRDFSVFDPDGYDLVFAALIENG